MSEDAEKVVSKANSMLLKHVRNPKLTHGVGRKEDGNEIRTN